jgi:hypothetical protein
MKIKVKKEERTEHNEYEQYEREREIGRDLQLMDWSVMSSE